MKIEDTKFDVKKVFDVVVSISGYERRSSYLCRLGVKGQLKLALELGDPVTDVSRRNREIYLEAGWTVSDGSLVMQALAQVLDESVALKSTPEVLVDISSMPRRTIANLLNILFTTAGQSRCNVTFAYVPGQFHQSSVAAGVSSSLRADPVGSSFAGHLRPSSIPVGLVLGLGLERHRAMGLVELLEPARSWVFVSKSDEPRFQKQALETHVDLIEGESGATVLTYDMRSIATTYNSLASLVFAVGIDYRMIIAPSGPKTFALAAMLVSLGTSHAKPAVWRVGETGLPIGVDVAEAGDVVSARIVPLAP